MGLTGRSSGAWPRVIGLHVHCSHTGESHARGRLLRVTPQRSTEGGCAFALVGRVCRAACLKGRGARATASEDGGQSQPVREHTTSGRPAPVGKRSRDAALTGHAGFAACAAAPSQQASDDTTRQWCTPLGRPWRRSCTPLRPPTKKQGVHAGESFVVVVVRKNSGWALLSSSS